MISFFRMLGPGLLYAGAAVGVSHLVQSTRAGADFGFELIAILLLANAAKYPFFEFGPRYATATGESLIDGYARLGRWALWLFALLTIGTMFSIQAAVTAVTAGIFSSVLAPHLAPQAAFAIILFINLLLLLSGRFSMLDGLMKAVILLLTVSTVMAVALSLGKGYHPDPALTQSFHWSVPAHLFFLIAFIGWMPAPIDVSVWHSLWTIAKKDSLKTRISLSQSLLDFRIGYIGTAVLAVGFLSLGALVMYGSGTSLDPRGAVFAGQLIAMYTESIGSWSYFLIAAAALTTMLSTTLTCLDAYPRVMRPLSLALSGRPESGISPANSYRLWMLIVAGGSLILFGLLGSTMRFMVDLAMRNLP
ncbi:MAG TPA: Nramp family divalent metal transporter, partial [Bacteroidales bacterium]|nr:Nramp family divalent metal transporter [Bacteroidales bacterium]